MTLLDQSYRALQWAADRLAETHRESVSLEVFTEALDTYILATRAYHHAIRQTNERIAHAHHQEGPHPRPADN